MRLDRLEASPDSAIGLLGATFRRGDVGGVIVETEFYDRTDPASHTFNGPTPRNQPMFERAGHLYVYRSYGIHWCANVVVGPSGHGSAVLIRALRPSIGTKAMWERRPKARTEIDLCSGPGKLCAALGLTGADSGIDLLADGPVAIELGDPPDLDAVVVGPRVGISKAIDAPWRFALRDPNVSRPRL